MPGIFDDVFARDADYEAVFKKWEFVSNHEILGVDKNNAIVDDEEFRKKLAEFDELAKSRLRKSAGLPEGPKREAFQKITVLILKARMDLFDSKQESAPKMKSSANQSKEAVIRATLAASNIDVKAEEDDKTLQNALNENEKLRIEVTLLTNKLGILGQVGINVMLMLATIQQLNEEKTLLEQQLREERKNADKIKNLEKQLKEEQAKADKVKLLEQQLSEERNVNAELRKQNDAQKQKIAEYEAGKNQQAELTKPPIPQTTPVHVQPPKLPVNQTVVMPPRAIDPLQAAIGLFGDNYRQILPEILAAAAELDASDGRDNEVSPLAKSAAAKADAASEPESYESLYGPD